MYWGGSAKREQMRAAATYEARVDVDIETGNECVCYCEKESKDVTQKETQIKS